MTGSQYTVRATRPERRGDYPSWARSRFALASQYRIPISPYRLAIVRLAALGVESVGMRRAVAQQVQRVGRECSMRREARDDSLAEACRNV